MRQDKLVLEAIVSTTSFLTMGGWDTNMCSIQHEMQNFEFNLVEEILESSSMIRCTKGSIKKKNIFNVFNG